MSAMKKVEIVAGVFIKDGKLFTARRVSGNYAGYWEFPGGKIEANETHEQALKREIFEELGAEIVIKDFVETVQHEYEDLSVTMHLYEGEFLSDPKPVEYEEFCWADVKEVESLKWLPADVQVLSRIVTKIKYF